MKTESLGWTVYIINGLILFYLSLTLFKKLECFDLFQMIISIFGLFASFVSQTISTIKDEN